eukprot:NODE_26206_length_560_cov_1.332564.p3 GENE.NODE_26206_length_560_cov_1.332564~~NODE_26206_length_560_cov_1.332564.p3  ORF type:complete len:71 (+),score=23.19 NODE_26206_length_560_cov_1.332564:199-411(+)
MMAKNRTGVQQLMATPGGKLSTKTCKAKGYKELSGGQTAGQGDFVAWHKLVGPTGTDNSHGQGLGAGHNL